MNRAIDLMPRSCREVLNRRMMVRRWTLVYVLTATALFASFWFLSLAKGVSIEDRDALTIKMKINWSRNETVNNLLREIAEVEGAVTRYNRLAWPVRATEAIDAVAASTPGSVTLLELSITPREEKASSKSASAQTSGTPAVPEAPRALMVMEMEGLAPDDVSVARFVSGLEQHPLFRRVALDFARAKPMGQGEVRNFRVTADIDLSLRYSFVDALPEGE